MFGTRLRVIWDGKGKCFEQQLPGLQLVSDIATTGTWNQDTRDCCGHEKAIMHLVSEADELKNITYTWLMEDDVHWTSKEYLARFFARMATSERYQAVDLLHTNKDLHQPRADLKAYHETNIARADAQIGPPYHKGEFQFYRLSTAFIRACRDDSRF